MAHGAWRIGSALGALTLGALTLGACGASTDSLPAAPDEHVVLGTGEAAFEPIDGEPRLELVAGVQGGFHVWASFLVYGIDSERVDLTLETRVDDDPEKSLVMHARILLRSVTDESGEPALSFAGFPAQIFDARCAQDRRVRVTLQLTDPAGKRLDDTRYCIADVPEAQRRSDCE